MRRESVRGRTRSRPFALVTSTSLVGIALLITGITLLVKRHSVICDATRGQDKQQQEMKMEKCSSSEEAKRSGLKVFLEKVQKQTFDLYPFLIARKPKVSAQEIRRVLNESYMQDILRPEFLSDLENDTVQLNDWKKKHNGRTPSQSLRQSVLEHVGRPIYALLRYLEGDHFRHCVPSNVSSGLSFQPVSYVYVNGTPNVTNRTTMVLPTGQPLNGSKAYLELLSFFTTTISSPDEVQELGYKMLAALYPQSFENRSNSDMFFNDMTFPPEESNKKALKLCRTSEHAEKNCPNRWKAIQQWFKEAREVMSMLDPKSTQMFYFTGKKQTTPNYPVELVPNFNPSAGVPSYRNSDRACTRNAEYFIPFFLERPGPRCMQWSVNAHEARPGHHTQVQGVTENFQDSCCGIFGWVSTVTSYTAFSEGWALYAENPLIAYDTDTYRGKPLYKYGMLKAQLWRALRMVVDTGLHSKDLTRQQALAMFEKYLWDDSDVIRKELTRYQSVPGQATAYMIGQLQILKLREYAEKKLGDAFSLKEFHFQVLRHGSV